MSQSRVPKNSLVQKIEKVRDKARRWILVSALAKFCVVLLAAMLVIGSIDFLLRNPDLGLRWIFTLGFTSICLFTAMRVVRPAFRLRLTIVDTARWVERAFPSIRDRLSSSLAVLDEREESAGGQSISQCLVRQTESELATFDFGKAIDRRPAIRAVVTAGLAVVAAIVLTLFYPRHIVAGVVRLVTPWNAMSWPTNNELEFERLPRVVVDGADLDVSVVDRRGVLPPRVELQIRTEDSTQVQRLRMRQLGNQMVSRLHDLRSDFQIRVLGGDDLHNRWHQVKIVTPPQISRLDVVAIPPKYTGMDETRVNNRARLLVGTRMKISGDTRHPIGRAHVLFTNEAGNETSTQLAVVNRNTFYSDALIVTESGDFTVFASDTSGTATGPIKTFQIEAVSDQPPTASLSGKSELAYATRDGRVSIAFSVADDLLVASADLIVSTPSGDLTFGLLKDVATTASVRSRDNPAKNFGRNRHLVESRYDLDLKSIDELRDGDVLDYWVRVVDKKEQTQESQIRQVLVVDIAELRNRLLQDELQALQQISAVRELQLVNLHDTQQLSANIGNEHSGNQDHASIIQRVVKLKLNQSRIQDRFEESDNSIHASLRQIAATLGNNNMGKTPFARQIATSISDLSRLRKTSVAMTSSTLTSIVKTLQLRGVDTNLKTLPLAAASAYQQSTLDGLDRLLQRVNLWTGFEDLNRKLIRLNDLQRELIVESERGLLASLEAPLNETGPSGSERPLYKRQLELTWSLEQFQRDLRLFAANSMSEASAKMNADAVFALFRDNGVVRKMRSAADELVARRMANAVELQRNIAKVLSEALELISVRGKSVQSSTNPQTANDATTDRPPKMIDIDNIVRQQQQIMVESNQIREQLKNANGNDPALRAKLMQLGTLQGKLADQIGTMIQPDGANE